MSAPALPSYQSRVFLLIPEVYTATRDGDLIDNLTNDVIDMALDADIDRAGSKGDFRVVSSREGAFPVNTWVAPFLEVRHEDQTVDRSQLGLYRLDEPTTTYHLSTAVSEESHGEDINSLYERAVMADPQVSAHTANVMEEIGRAMRNATRVVGPNLISNGDFATDMSGWTLSIPGGPTSVMERMESNGVSDGPYMRLRATATGTGVVQAYQDVAVSPGDTIYVGTWAYPNNDRAELHIRIEWFSSSGMIGTSSMPGGATSRWRYIEKYAVAPENAQTARVLVHANFTTPAVVGDAFAFQFIECRKVLAMPLEKNALPIVSNELGGLKPYPHIAHPANTSWLERINDLATAIGYHATFPNSQGLSTTRPMRDIRSDTPKRVYEVGVNSSIVSDVVITRSTGNIYNVVTVVKENYESGVVTVVQARNDDKDHPWSTVNRGELAPRNPVVANDAVDTAAMQAIADEYLARASMAESIEIDVLPDPYLTVHDIIEVVSPNSRQSGRWAIDSIQWGMNALDPMVRIRARRTYLGE